MLSTEQIKPSLFDTVNPSDIVTITFGITSGILTLVGLISIYVSLNTQHSLQKCKELYWNIVSLTKRSIIGSRDQAQEKFKENFYLYHHIYKEGIPEKSTITIIHLSIYALYFVMLVWAVTVIAISGTLNSLELSVAIFACLGSFAIILLFVSFLNKLTRILEDQGLLAPEDFLNPNNGKKINTLPILGALIRIQAEKHYIMNYTPQPVSEYLVHLHFELDDFNPKNIYMLPYMNYTPTVTFKDGTVAVLPPSTLDLSTRPYGNYEYYKGLIALKFDDHAFPFRIDLKEYCEVHDEEEHELSQETMDNIMNDAIESVTFDIHISLTSKVADQYHHTDLAYVNLQSGWDEYPTEVRSNWNTWTEDELDELFR